MRLSNILRACGADKVQAEKPRNQDFGQVRSATADLHLKGEVWCDVVRFRERRVYWGLALDLAIRVVVFGGAVALGAFALWLTTVELHAAKIAFWVAVAVLVLNGSVTMGLQILRQVRRLLTWVSLDVGPTGLAISSRTLGCKERAWFIAVTELAAFRIARPTVPNEYWTTLDALIRGQEPIVLTRSVEAEQVETVAAACAHLTGVPMVRDV